MTLQNIVDEIDQRCDDEILRILFIAYAKKTGKISGAIPYRIDPQLIDLIIDRLTELIFILLSN